MHLCALNKETCFTIYFCSRRSSSNIIAKKIYGVSYTIADLCFVWFMKIRFLRKWAKYLNVFRMSYMNQIDGSHNSPILQGGAVKHCKADTTHIFIFMKHVVSYFFMVHIGVKIIGQQNNMHLNHLPDFDKKILKPNV